MAGAVPEERLGALSELVSRRMGLHFPSERWRDLERGMQSAAREFDFKNVESCFEWLASSPLTKTQIEILASHLTVGETYFFREARTFEVLEQHILPELIRSRRGADRRLRVWSAGCATGEEPFSIAILVSKLLADLDDWNVCIVATDINPRFLEKARIGLYGEWSFRGTPAWVKEQYFREHQRGRFEIFPSIKSRVALAYLNLAEDTYPSLLTNTNAMDVIFCRNVLMYFAPEQARRVIHGLHRSLVEGGWLIVSPSELSHVLFSQFATVQFPGAILYRKDGLQREAAGLSSAGSGEEESALPEMRFDLAPLHAQAASPRAWDHSPPFGLADEIGRRPQPPHDEEALPPHGEGREAEAAGKIADPPSGRPDGPQAMALQARAFANQGKLGDALECCERAVAADKMNAAVHFLRAAILQEQGSIEEARAALKRCLYLDPKFVLAHFSLGNLALRQAKQEFRKHFENALTLLGAYREDEPLPESEGITAARLKQIIRAATYGETDAGTRTK